MYLSKIYRWPWKVCCFFFLLVNPLRTRYKKLCKAFFSSLFLANRIELRNHDRIFNCFYPIAFGTLLDLLALIRSAMHEKGKCIQFLNCLWDATCIKVKWKEAVHWIVKGRRALVICIEFHAWLFPSNDIRADYSLHTDDTTIMTV